MVKEMEVFLDKTILQHNLYLFEFQEEQNRGKTNWEHLSEELHVKITVEDSQERAKAKIARAVEEIKKLLVPTVSRYCLANVQGSIVYLQIHCIYFKMGFVLCS